VPVWPVFPDVTDALEALKVASVRSPHVTTLPAVTAVNSPGGGSLSPELLLPQYLTVPSLRSPQACPEPAATP
jgi:hypothetical protein